jgi:hypothetical protein
MNKIIYVVTTGEYSDYRLDSMYTKRELAQKYIDKFHSCLEEPVDIVEWTLDEMKQTINSNYNIFDVVMKKDGEVEKVEIDNMKLEEFKADDIWFDGLDNIHCKVKAKSEKHAIKIVNEKRAQLIALNKWGIKKERNE